MSEYIMNRESLKRHCETTCKKFKDVPTSGAYGEHMLVLDLLEQTEWIPCSKELPKIHNYSEKYIVTLRCGDIDIATFTECEGEHWWNYNYDDVIAWMPKPKPYYETETEKDGV